MERVGWNAGADNIASGLSMSGRHYGIHFSLLAGRKDVGIEVLATCHHVMERF
jgi:hypothetical protein